MKIAALIRVHHRPQNLEILLDRLDGPLWKPILHINRLSDIRQFSRRAIAASIPTRIPIYWGGWSMVEASLLLMQTALRDPELTHLCLLSGQCYPLKSDQQIQEFIDDLPKGEANLLTVAPMPAPTKPVERLSEWHFNDMKPGLLQRLAGLIAPLLPRRRNVKRVMATMALNAGSGWWLFERETVQKILDHLAENAWYLDAFRWSLVPDEMFFQILVVALKIPLSGPAPTFARWIQGRSNPEVVTPEIYEEALASNRLFARKFEDFYPEGETARALPQAVEVQRPPLRIRLKEAAFAFTRLRRRFT